MENPISGDRQANLSGWVPSPGKETDTRFIALTQKSSGIGSGQQPVMLSANEIAVPKGKVSSTSDFSVIEDTELFQRLKALRKTIADRDGVPPYVVFPDRSLHEMAKARPGDEESFRAISGVGELKWKKYGTEFIDAIRNGE